MLLECTDKNYETVFNLFNPFLNKCINHIQNHIQLPKTEEVVRYRNCLFFSTPSYPNGVLLVTKSDNSFLLYRQTLNDSDHYEWENDGYNYKWEGTVVSNVIICKGKSYAVEEDWSLAVIIDPLFPTSVTSVRMGKTKLPALAVQDESHVMVESCGEILSLMVRESPSGFQVDIFRADTIRMEWLKVLKLGDLTMFLSQISPVSICALSVLAPEMVTERNSIYYAPSETHWTRGLHQKFVNNYVYHEIELGRNGTLMVSDSTITSLVMHGSHHVNLFVTRTALYMWIVFG